MNYQSPFYFLGNLPDSIPACDLTTIVDVTRSSDIDRLEVAFTVNDDNNGFFISGLVFLNKENDEGYYFNGVIDNAGNPFLYPDAAAVMHDLRLMADETTVELSIFGINASFPFKDDNNFFNQIENGNLQWAKQQLPVLKDTDVIPHGSYCGGCPYLSHRPDKPEQSDGYCSYLEYGDWMTKLGFSLLWDGLKECHINLDE